MKTFLKFLLFLLVVAVASILFAFSSYRNILEEPISDNTAKKVFFIESCLSAYQVLDKLQSEEILNNNQHFVLKVYLKYEKTPGFKEGTFKIPLNSKLKDLVDQLEHPELTDIWITIPEGLRKDEIAKIIAKSYEGVEGAEFSEKEFLRLSKDPEYIYNFLKLTNVTDLEGYLFPDKYLMPAQATTDYILKTLTGTFKDKVGKISYKELIVASMIEREGKSDSDRPQISDVIWKRLKSDWLLQIDATLLYYYKDWKHVITQADKELNQPYNSYKRAGLPPTPICNPGLASINAAKNPQKNPYYFYIHADNGKVYFAETFEQHQNNIAKYLR